MRTIDPDLQASLDGGATTLCRCWRITRADGRVFGFTDHDRPITFEGTPFRPETGLDATALQTSTGLSVDNTQAMGALTDDAITEDDIRAGRFDSARVDQWLVDWRAPARRVHLFCGSIGEIRRTEGAFEVELRGLTEALNVPVGRTIARTCDRVVGDAKCGVALGSPAFSYVTEATGPAKGATVTGLSDGGFAEGWFTDGVLRWLDGRNEGLTAVVRADRAHQGGRVLGLVDRPPLPVTAGDRFLLTAGCDKTAATCRKKFANFPNFRGFPHIPGEDWVVAYPKNGDVHDGSSLGRR
jgi:uncharacterized phage protein (TIGR02218 family)